MTCHQFKAQLHEYLDGALEADQHAAAHAHFEQCADCRLALQQAQRLGRAEQQALAHASAPITLDAALTGRILAAAQAHTPSRSHAARAWQWLIDNPLRPLAAAAALIGGVLVNAQFRDALTESPASLAQSERTSYSVDVPLPVETHVFKIENGMVTDAVGTQVAVSRARFSSAAQRPSAP